MTVLTTHVFYLWVVQNYDLRKLADNDYGINLDLESEVRFLLGDSTEKILRDCRSNKYPHDKLDMKYIRLLSSYVVTVLYPRVHGEVFWSKL